MINYNRINFQTIKNIVAARHGGVVSQWVYNQTDDSNYKFTNQITGQKIKAIIDGSTILTTQLN